MERRRKFVVAPILIAIVVVAFQYCSSERYINPETGRSARVALTPEQEDRLGLQSYQQLLAQEDISESGPEVELVTRVAKRLTSVTGEAANSFDWRVSVVRHPQANAFCLPGGKILVYTGILPVAQSEAGLAAVLSQEMAHATSRHGAQRLLQSHIANTVMSGAQMSIALGDLPVDQQRAVLGAIGAGAKFGVILPFSREHETEADQVGLLYMARAGFDPPEAIRFWERMSEASQGQQPPEFASTHPAHGTRRENLKEWMPRALEEYQRSSGVSP